jgi:hypothetical protein
MRCSQVIFYAFNCSGVFNLVVLVSLVCLVCLVIPDVPAVQTYEINKTNQMNQRNAVYLWGWLNQLAGWQLLVQHRQFSMVPLEDFSQASNWGFPLG